MKGALRCVLFDLDGTLVDTAPDLAYALNRVRAEAGLPELPLAAVRPVASLGVRGLLRIGLALAPDDVRYPVARDRLLEIYRGNLARSSSVFPGLDPVLENLERRGLPWGVVTNKPGWLAGPLMQALGLGARMICLVAGDSAPRPKPYPDPLLMAANRAKVAPETCVYVGDDRRDVEAGRAAGMRTVAAAWGYLGENEDPAAWGADAVAADPMKLPQILGAPPAV